MAYRLRNCGWAGQSPHQTEDTAPGAPGPVGSHSGPTGRAASAPRLEERGEGSWGLDPLEPLIAGQKPWLGQMADLTQGLN